MVAEDLEAWTLEHLLLHHYFGAVQCMGTLLGIFSVFWIGEWLDRKGVQTAYKLAT